VGVKSDICTKAKEYLSGDYEVEEVDHIPTVEKVAFGKKAKKAKVCAFSIDLRKSTDLLYDHQKQTAGKIHKAFLHVAASTVLHFGGEIRSFKGDSLLALWPANYKSEITRCVRAAMTVKWLLDVELAPEFKQFSEIDFGIGVDWGEVFIARAGIPRNANNNDLIFMGRCINFAVALGEQAHGPHHVEISTSTYENLEEEAIYGEGKDWLGQSKQIDMWGNGAMKWQGSTIPTKLTTWYWELND
jgi:adenylate cyclase